MVVRSQCRKCKATIQLDFGNLTKEEAIQTAEYLDHTPRECPGFHTELGGWRKLWNLDDAIHRAYDLNEGKEPQTVISDEEYVKQLLTEGKEIVDGGSNTTPSLHLRSIHEYKDLTHLGFGDFASETHLFLRCDSPRGTRFYERVSRYA